ncbi:MAG: hypothetical protein QCI38_01130 [Candidatus Thermoplasmatota archaeon]|nr:hypothetical protein [Candidatus Thermoplasmatota archaeon]
MVKDILFRWDDYPEMTMEDLKKKVEQLKLEHPEMDIFVDGDERAICGRPKDR